MKSRKSFKPKSIIVAMSVILIVTLVQSFVITFCWNTLAKHFQMKTMISPPEAILLMILSNFLFGSGVRACGYR